MRLPAVVRSRPLRFGSIVAVALSALGLLAAGCGPSDEREGLFDSSTVHEITVTFDQAAYEAMIETYQDSGDKDWLEATVTIDGETYENVGMRLKGNSSIMALGGRGPAQFMGPGGGNARTDTTETTTVSSTDTAAAATTETTSTTSADSTSTTTTDGAAAAARRDFAGPMGGNTSADEPQGLPWLVDLDRNVDGQNHENVVEFVVRSNNSETALNEAVALELNKAAGLASQDAVAAGFSVNGSEPKLRLVIENPDDVWMANNFDIGGALYKAQSTGDYSYRGADPDAYGEVFDQEAGKTNADLTPLMEFLDFINNSDDATFDTELFKHLDVDSFATYLAMQELLANFDDMDGPGNNSYLYYDPKSGQFTVVAWDHNLAFGGLGDRGGFGGGAVTVMPGAGGQVEGDLPEGMEPPDGMQFPDNAQGPQGQQFPGMMKPNVLKERLMADPEFKQLYEERLVELKSRLYESGDASEILSEWVTVLKTQASELVDASTVDEEAAKISEFFTAQ